MKAALDAIQNGDTQYLASLLNTNPNLAKKKTEQGISLLQFAAYCKNSEAVKLLKLYLDELTLHELACIGDVDGIKKILSKNPQLIDSFSADGFTPLGLAAYFGHVELVRFLLIQNANPNVPSNNSFRVTPLHSACASSNLEIAKLLIEYHADVNTKQQKGVTPLHSAAHNGNKDLVRLLVRTGADLHVKMENGKSPLDLAKENGFSDILENL